MPIDWIYGLAGGVLIGTAAAIYLLVNGRIMGASGILGGLIDGTGHSEARERLALIAGLLAVPALLAWSSGSAQTYLTDNAGVIVVSGLLVGIGTRVANGCTSGHGVCGISRLNPRGIVASVVYILAGAATVLLFRHVLGAI